MQKLWSILPALALLLSTLPTSALAAAAPSGQNGLDPTAYLNSDGTLSIPEDFSGSFDLAGWDVRLHPSKGVVFRPPQATLGQWTSLGGAGTGTNSNVYEVVLNGGVIYAGGLFTDAGGDPDADHIAKFSGGTWSSLGGAGTGLNSHVIDIEFVGGVLYAGGNFTDAGGDADADYIAMFNGGTWSSLGGAGTGLNGGLFDIEFNGGVLYAGGVFTDAGGNADADRIAKFSGGAWSSLGGAGTGVNSYVYEIEFDGGVLYAGGNFTDAGGDTDADHIAKFSGGAWSSLGGAGTGISSGFFVGEIIFDGGVLYAGGNFTDAGGDADADYIAKFSGGAWSSLGGAGTGLNYEVIDIVFNGGTLYANGGFTNAGGDADADRIAKFSGGAWTSLGGTGTGLNGYAYDMEFNGAVLYAGGLFTDAGGDADADYIAQFGLSAGSSSGEGSSGEGSTGSSGEGSTGGQQSSKEVAASGTTTFYFQRSYVSVPASAIPQGETNCKIVVANKGDSGQYGFELDDVVYDVKIVCDSGSLTILFAPITVCIRPKDGITSDKSIFHKHTGAGSFVALAGGSEPNGYVCGSTNALSLFTLGQLSLPDTGFAPGAETILGEQPTDLAYSASDLVLNIPTLNVELDIVGVPLLNGDWDVSWLASSQAGYLYGTTFPTWEGNSVLTAHVWNADNTAGPFYALKNLQYGYRFTITAYGQTYTYEVRSNKLVSEQDLSVMKHSDYSLITLITCESYSEGSGEYLYRRAVQAVLVDVQ